MLAACWPTLVAFVRAVIRHGVAILTGSILCAAIAIGEHLFGANLSWKLYATFIGLTVLWSCFEAWRDKDSATTNLMSVLEDTRKQLQSAQEALRSTTSTKEQNKSYNDDVRKIAEQALGRWGEDGKKVVRYMLLHEPVEVGRTPVPDVHSDEQATILNGLFQEGILRHETKRQRAMTWNYWVIAPQFKEVLKDILYNL